MIGLLDSRLSIFYRIYKPINLFFEYFFILFLVGYYVKSYRDIKYIYNKFFWFFIVFTIYGISNFITKRNEFFDFIVAGYGGRNFPNDHMVRGLERFRVASFTWQPIYYGFLVSIMLMLEFFILTATKMIERQKVKHLVLVVLLIINLFLANSRTPIFILFAGASIYILFSFDLIKKIKILIILVIISGFAISYVPYVSNLFIESTNVISSDSDQYENGSSVSMRETQLAASLLLFSKNPIFGNGIDFITEDLGYASDENKRKTGNDLMGFESYVYKLLIEQGIVGITANLVLLFLLFYWHIKYFSEVNFLGRKMIVLNIACLISFILFVVGTGDLGTFLFFMSFLSINIRFIQLSNKNTLKKIL